MENEAAFHDALLHSDGRPADRFYAINESSWSFYRTLLIREAWRHTSLEADARILEYGSGIEGHSSRVLAAKGLPVVGIDISPASIQAAREQAAREFPGVALDYQVMNAEALDFPDESFDLVCGNGILHHLDLRRAYSEVSRVLAPTGSAVFSEPLGHNKLINLYRRRTPDQRTPDEHPLRISDIRLAHSFFGTVEAHYFHLCSLLAIPLTNMRGFKPLLHTLDRVDRIVFKTLPSTRRNAWLVVLRLSRPRTSR